MTLLRSHLTVEGRRGDPWCSPSKKIAEKPSLKSQNPSGQLGETTTRSTSLTVSMRGHTTSLLPSGTWLPLLTIWALRSTRCRRCGLARKTSGPLTAWPKLPPRTSASLQLCHPPNCPKSWAWMVGWVVLLSMVWKRRTEWGYSGKPPTN